MKTHTIILYMGLLTALVAGCSGNSDSPSVPSSTAISFTAAAPHAPSPRSVITTSSLNDFTVYAFTGGLPYMNGVRVHKSGDNWTYSPTFYWPVDSAVNFYSYAPSDFETGGVTAIPGAGAGQPDILQFRNPGTVDFLYGVNMSMTRHTPQVRVNLRHALSQVRIYLRVDDSYPLQATVSDVGITNVCTNAQFYFPRRTTLPGSDEVSTFGSWDISANTQRTTVEMYSHGNLVFGQDRIPVPTDVMFFIPQSVTGCQLQLRAQLRDASTGVIVWPASDADGYDSATKTALILIPINTSAQASWRIGTCYRYDVTLTVPRSSDTIDFDVTVDDYPDFININNEN